MTTTAVQKETQQKLFDIIVQQDDISWKSLIFDLIDRNEMDPWDINISNLAKAFLVELKKLKQMDLRISGKVILASAVLLKLKAEKLHQEEVAALDTLIQSVEQQDMVEEMDLFTDAEYAREEIPKLIPKTPQPRQRKVSVYDLVEALEQALEIEARRPPVIIGKKQDVKVTAPENHVDITTIIKEVYDLVYKHYEEDGNEPGSLQFTHILRSDDRRDKVIAFVPLLHLENHRKVEMEQPEHFGDITLHLLDKEPPKLGKEE